MMHPDTRLQWISDIVGHGVVATARIPAGTIVWAPDPLDLRISAAAFAALPAMVRTEVEHFSYADQSGLRVLAWDRARYVNHRCIPTCVSGGYDCNVAAVDLEPGDELTDDYGSYLPQDMACACDACDAEGVPRCRGVISRRLAGPLIAGWDERFRRVFPRISVVDQPLWPLLGEPDQRRIRSASAGHEPVASIAELIGVLD